MISLRDVVTGFGNRDPLAEVWRRDLRGGGGGAAEITGVPPLRYIGDGRPLTDYRVAGNTVQDGTPSPDAPVDAAGCGVRTGNLFDYLTMADGTPGYYLGENGSEISSSAWAITGYIPCNGTSFTLSAVGGSFPAICLYDENKQLIAAQRYGTGGAAYKAAITVTSVQTAKYVRFSWYRNHDVAYDDPATLMLNLGSTALPYEPYGYKLPLTVNGTEYPIYLGQVETTRRIKKLVFDGTEDARVYAYPAFAFRVNTSDAKLNYRYCACTHFPYQPTPLNSTRDGVTAGVGDRNLYFTFSSSSAAQLGIVAGDTNSFKSYLAAQYAAGTPVTVWYVLATEETGIVNEPLHKIGNYTDTVDFAQAGVTIPTVSGENILDVPTEVKPSEVTIKGGISSV